VGGFPDVSRVTLAWTNAVAVASISTSVSNDFGLNSAFDPGQATASTQPTNFDLWGAIYTYYRVLSTQVEFHVGVEVPLEQTSAGGGGQASYGPVEVAITPTNTTAGFTLDNFWTNPRSVCRTATAAKPVRLVHIYDAASVIGQTRSQYRCNESARALTSADPVNRESLYLSLRSADNAQSNNVTVVTRFLMDVEFYRLAPVDVDLVTRIKAIRDAFAAKKRLSGWFKSPDPPGMQRVFAPGVETKGDVKSLGQAPMDEDETSFDLLDESKELAMLRKYKAVFLGGAAHVGAGMALVSDSEPAKVKTKVGSQKGT
jgi:hypothetical protein